jgi:hypothetical protein
MNYPPETPVEMLTRLTNHLSVIARRTTETADILRRLETLIRVGLIVWIAFPVILLLLLLLALVRLLS